MKSVYAHAQVICDGKPCKRPVNGEGQKAIIDTIADTKVKALQGAIYIAKTNGWQASPHGDFCSYCLPAAEGGGQ